jgi:chorismate-pyruvate lyase
MAPATRTRRAKPAARRTAVHGDILYPLNLAYAQAGVPLPVTREISPKDIPFPYRSLLVHENDMTLTLERHFGGAVFLRTLSTVAKGSWYLRRVLLVQEYSGRPVEMGAIRIRIDGLAPRTRALILRHEVPLGRVLRDAGVDFRSQPRAFFSVVPNQEMMGVFWMREPRTLYGRQTEIFQGGTKFGDIVEVLPLV